jgi:hypothetical protein
MLLFPLAAHSKPAAGHLPKRSFPRKTLKISNGQPPADVFWGRWLVPALSGLERRGCAHSAFSVVSGSVFAACNAGNNAAMSDTTKTTAVAARLTEISNVFAKMEDALGARCMHPIRTRPRAAPQTVRRAASPNTLVTREPGEAPMAKRIASSFLLVKTK